MKVIIQRVLHSSVTIDKNIVAQIGKGINVLLGITHSDTEKEINWLVSKIKGLRIFEDGDKKMNLSLEEVEGEILVVSQFTLYGECIKGRRPSFCEAARAELAEALYEKFLEKCKNEGLNVKSGVFGADMKVEILNDGPVTIIIDTKNVPSL